MNVIEASQQHHYRCHLQLLFRDLLSGPDNPLSQVFSRASAQRMFWQFKNLKTEIMFWNPNWLPGIGKLLPRSVEDRLASHWGWHLWIYAQKRHLEFTGLKETPYPEHFAVNGASPVLAEPLVH